MHVAPLVLLLCPSLREVAISFDETPSGGGHLSDVLGSVLQNLALTAPHLKELKLLGNHSLGREHLLYLERFISIQDICLSHHFYLDDAILQALSEIPTIRHLFVAVRLGRGGRKEALDFGDRFHGLRNLELRGTHKDVSDVVAAMSAPRLDLIALEFTDSPSMNAPFSAIAPHIPDTITGYSCTFSAALDPLPKSLADLLDSLPSRMPKLVSFDLTSEKSPLSVTNDDLARLGDAWPLLRHFTIRQSADRFNLEGVRRPHVSALAALAKRCPKLKTLNLPELDIAKPTGANTNNAIPIPLLDHRLKELLFQSISISPTKAQHEAAVAIDMMFPHLDLRTMRPGYRGATKSGVWVNMWKTLEIMRWGRKNRALADGGCESAVPEVPEMPVEEVTRRRLGLPLPHHAHHLPVRSGSQSFDAFSQLIVVQVGTGSWSSPLGRG